MSLRVKCKHCGRELHLDPAFLGGCCRCQYCRSLMSVPSTLAPHASVPSSSSVRPTRPTLTGERKAPRPAATGNSGVSRAGKLSWSALSTRTRLRTAIASLAVVTTASLLYGLSSWSQRSSDALVHHDEPLFGAGDRWAVDSDDNKANLLAANPITHYFGIPLSGRTIGCIVDGDATMAPYIDNVATITNSVFSSIEKGTRRFGVMQAVERDGRTAVEVAEPSTDLEGARSILTGRLASGRTDLGKALGVASNWYADEVFLVLSKPVDERQMEILTQGAEQTSAVVHVIALGGAAKQDLSPIAKATGGRFVPVTDDEVEKLVERQNDAKAAL